MQDEDRYIAATYGEPMRRLSFWDRPAQTRAGAAQALKLVLAERLALPDMGVSLVAAALAYLESDH